MARSSKTQLKTITTKRIKSFFRSSPLIGMTGWVLFFLHNIISYHLLLEVSRSTASDALANFQSFIAPPSATITAEDLTIIAIGCSRPDGLLKTLNSAKALHDLPPSTKLHICIDGCSSNDNVKDVADRFEWAFGEKRVTRRDKPMGLARHITSCWEDPKPNDWALFLEDDCILSPHAFSAFQEARLIRSQHPRKDQIIGVAMHDSRVNQFCWKDFVSQSSPACPKLKEECSTYTDRWGILGTLMCLHNDSAGSWNLNQFPSSWGAWYEGRAWSLYKKFFEHRVNLTMGESLLFMVPHSMSNEWTHSWKRFLHEFMFRAGWTVMYRSNSMHKGLSQTLRGQGVHTSKDQEKESRSACLVSTPLEESFSADTTLLENGAAILSYDYCLGQTSVDELTLQGRASLDFLRKFPVSLIPSGNVQKAIDIIQEELDSRSISIPDVTEHGVIMSSGYNITFLDKTEILMVTSFVEVDKYTRNVLQSFSSFQGRVHFLVVAPLKTCQSKIRGNIYATCIDEVEVMGSDKKNKLPKIPDMLRVAKDYAGPNTKWIGFMNGDVSPGGNFPDVLKKLHVSDTCSSSRCMLCGQRHDIDLKTKEEKLHSAYGMDYFIFNMDGLDYILEKMPPFRIGLVRWDSWLMASMSLDDSINTIDLTGVLKLSHFMDFEDAYKSKTNNNLWNLKLADEKIPLGRTDYANFRVTGDDLNVEPAIPTEKLSAGFLKNRCRYAADRAIEELTNFTYTSGRLQTADFQCLCGLIKAVLPSKVYPQICTDSLITKANANEKKQNLYFHNEFFAMLIGREFIELPLSLEDVPDDNAKTQCCILKGKSKPPSQIPDTFWMNEQKLHEVGCIFI